MTNATKSEEFNLVGSWRTQSSWLMEQKFCVLRKLHLVMGKIYAALLQEAIEKGLENSPNSTGDLWDWIFSKVVVGLARGMCYLLFLVCFITSVCLYLLSFASCVDANAES